MLCETVELSLKLLIDSILEGGERFGCNLECSEPLRVRLSAVSASLLLGLPHRSLGGWGGCLDTLWPKARDASQFHCN